MCNKPYFGPLRSTTEVSTVQTSHRISNRTEECGPGEEGLVFLNTPLATNFLYNPHHTSSIQPCFAHSSQGFLPSPPPSEHSMPMPPLGIRWLVRLNLLQEQDRHQPFLSFRNDSFYSPHTLFYFFMSIACKVPRSLESVSGRMPALRKLEVNARNLFENPFFD